MQKRAARFTLNDYSRDSSATTLVQELGWESLAVRRHIARLSHFYKAYHQQSPITLSHLSHPTRGSRYSNASTFISLQTSTDVYKYSFIPRTLNDWNTLPTHLHISPSVDSFKESLHKLTWD